MEMRKLVIADVILVILGLILIVFGCAFFDKKIKDAVEQNVVLVNGTDAYNSWKDPEAPIYISFYFFSVLNVDEVVQNSSKPSLEQHGPFTYREYRNKTDIKFMEDQTKIYYKEHKYYVFDEKQSPGYDENFTICTLNIPFLTLATRARFQIEILQDLLALILNRFGEGLFQCHSVKELLWGYTPNSIEEINKFFEKFQIPFKINYTVGIYSGPTGNGTDDGETVVNSGVGNVENLGLIEKWRGNSSLPFWHGSCNTINGSDGTLWHPFVDKTDRLYIFNTDLCRSIYVTYRGSSEVSSSDIPVYQFAAPQEVMADPRTHPENRCFCSPYDANATFCLRAGVLNVSSCKQDAPIIMSQPHFFEAPDYVNEVIGLNPNATIHETLLDVEPITGVVFNAAKRIQINMFVTYLRGLRDTYNLNKSIVFPVFWVDEHATIPNDVAAAFYHKVILPMKVAEGVKYGLIALGGFLLLCALILLIVILLKRNRDKSSSEEGDPDQRTPLLADEA